MSFFPRASGKSNLWKASGGAGDNAESPTWTQSCLLWPALERGLALSRDGGKERWLAWRWYWVRSTLTSIEYLASGSCDSWFETAIHLLKNEVCSAWSCLRNAYGLPKEGLPDVYWSTIITLGDYVICLPSLRSEDSSLDHMWLSCKLFSSMCVSVFSCSTFYALWFARNRWLNLEERILDSFMDMLCMCYYDLSEGVGSHCL